ncbi:hypothetical protein [Mesoterricola sediminis]|nr:hypothetical protein [Mesoterricola sediminis]
MRTWINVKEAAAMVGISEKRFRSEWVPEDGPAQVTFRCTNGHSGPSRRIEVLLEDLLMVIEERTTRRGEWARRFL